MDVLPIERRDERAVEPVHHLVGDLVGLVLQPLDPLHDRGAALRGRVEQVTQQLGGFLVAIGHLDKQVEELFFTR